MTQNLEARNQAEANLIHKAWTNESFKKDLLANPTPVYTEAMQEAGAQLPEGTQVHAVEENSSRIYLIIPNTPVEASGELGDRSTRGDLESSLVSRAQKDASAKQELLADPKSAYEAQLSSVRSGAKLPADMEVKAVEESDNVIYFRLPEAPPKGAELTEEDLENVAGGAAVVGVAIASTVVVGAVAVAALLVHEPVDDFGTKSY